jgi:iron(III) transport system ATP-binding protein
MTALRITAASKAYGAVPALTGVDMSVPAGSLAAVLGPSGCGKTTLLRCIAGLERLDAGEIQVAGRTVAGPRTHLPAHRRRVALVPQEGALFPHLSVADNVGYGLDRAARRSGRVDEALTLVGLERLHDRMPHQLSGGQQQRVALARAMAPRPPLILLDEPFSALDAGLRAELRQDVRAALRADRATAVLVTHDQSEALSLADHVVVMRGGSAVQSGTPADIYSGPADPWVARFVGDAMLLPGTASAGHAHTVAGRAPLVNHSEITGERPVTVLIRPEQLRLTPARPETPDSITAQVTRIEFHGHDSLTTVRLSDGTELLSRQLSDGYAELGSTVTLRIHGLVRAWEPEEHPGRNNPANGVSGGLGR